MGPSDLLLHVLNFFAPALGVAVMTALLSRILMKKGTSTPGLIAQAAINFVVCALVLLAGLWFFGRDGKMATYAALVVACATSQLWMLRGGRR